MTSHKELRRKFSNFWEKNPRNHKHIQPAPLVLLQDPTTLFTSAGMQPLVPYLSGQFHPMGKRLYNIQPCFRAVDIDEVGDNRHTTFFEMMGNWSLGDYFKEEQLAWVWEFFINVLNLSKEKLYISIFEGHDHVERDKKSYDIWKSLGVSDKHIFEYGVDKNWWSRSGAPDKMPIGEIGGPTSEIFYEFDSVKHDPKFANKCHPNCNCGKFLEIGNTVFMVYKMTSKGLAELPNKNVDYGGGLERILMAVNNQQDIFQIDLFAPIIEKIEGITEKRYQNEDDKADMRIIADHLKGATLMLAERVIPSNKMQGYAVRRLIRRVAVKLYDLKKKTKWQDVADISKIILKIYDGVVVGGSELENHVIEQINLELKRFTKTLDRGMKEFEKIDRIDERAAFDLYQNYGFPFEVTAELSRKRGVGLDKHVFNKKVKEHAERSRSASAGMFRGGLADHSKQVVKYHTATHLLHQALRDILGKQIRQEGSNITGERLRFDFSSTRKPTEQEIKRVQDIINRKITESLPVRYEIMSKKRAEQLGAVSFFKEKYEDKVKVYFIEGKTSSSQDVYSKEFCGGPHVKNTSEIGSIKIYKLKTIGANRFRIYAK